MEAANEAARRAVNGILDATNQQAPRCTLWPLVDPPTLLAFREYDAARLRLGLPWDATLVELASSALEAANPEMAVLADLMRQAQPFDAALESATDDDTQDQETVPRALEHLELASPHVYQVPPAAAVPGHDVELTPEVQLGDQAADDAGNEGPEDFLQRLEWYRQVTMEEISRVIPLGEPAKYLYEPMRAFVARPAKGIRPALCLATCRSHGGRFEDAVASAAGLELMHQAFLVHDDLEDESLMRRGAPTLHRQIGQAAAINAGDALNAYAMRAFRTNADRHDAATALAIFDEVDHLLTESLEGQAMEIGWIRDNRTDTGVDDYLRLVLKKTAWYSFIHPIRIGALSAGRSEDLDRFNRLGFLLGAAFQIQDDVLNLAGSYGRYGKEISGDLWEGKRTLLLTGALEMATPSERSRLEGFLGRSRQDRLPREVGEISRIVERTGALSWARQAAQSLAQAAADELPVAYREAVPGPDLSFVRSLVSFLVERDV
jgi:geranylgeranyl pyrophosphate synthase